MVCVLDEMNRLPGTGLIRESKRIGHAGIILNYQGVSKDFKGSTRRPAALCLPVP